MRHLLLALALAATAAVASAQPVYDCRRTSGTMTIDGRLTEATWEQAPWTDTFRDIRGREEGPHPTLSARAKMLYDDEYLYVGACVEETDISATLTQHDAIVWKDNDFEVFLDPYGTGRLYYEIECNALGTVMDLCMEKPYCEGGSFMLGWDCQGLRLAVWRDGSLNSSNDTDRGWTVEMAIPFASLQHDFDDPRQHRVWRMNFSRVEWPRDKSAREENWVWAPTGVVDIHHPDRWGYVRFVAPDGTVAQIDTARVVKNWMWERLRPDESDEDYAEHFRKVHDAGISAILFEGYDKRIYRLCHEAGLEAHYWKWTMNRSELLQTHPEWYAVNRKGESCHDKPPYVGYYRFLCPTHPEVADYLADDYAHCGALEYVDGMHLDYVRFPDVILPVSLWKNYGIDQSSELPEYDYCYCDACRAAFEAQTGKDPLALQYPQESQSWVAFRLDAITRVVTHIHDRMHAEGRFLSAAVFPGPSMARKMVRQDWGHWPLEAFFPMTYNGFYDEGPEWIGRSVAESVEAVGGKAPIYPGLFFPNIQGEDFVKALDAAFGAGASGVAFFDGPDDEHLLLFKAYLAQHNLRPVEVRG